eukprot:gene25942-11621_t
MMVRNMSTAAKNLNAGDGGFSRFSVVRGMIAMKYGDDQPLSRPLIVEAEKSLGSWMASTRDKALNDLLQGYVSAPMPSNTSGLVAHNHKSGMNKLVHDIPADGPYVSLLFNLGPEAREYLQEMEAKAESDATALEVMAIARQTEADALAVAAAFAAATGGDLLPDDESLATDSATSNVLTTNESRVHFDGPEQHVLGDLSPSPFTGTLAANASNATNAGKMMMMIAGNDDDCPARSMKGLQLSRSKSKLLSADVIPPSFEPGNSGVFSLVCRNISRHASLSRPESVTTKRSPVPPLVLPRAPSGDDSEGMSPRNEGSPRNRQCEGLGARSYKLLGSKSTMRTRVRRRSLCLNIDGTESDGTSSYPSSCPSQFSVPSPLRNAVHSESSRLRLIPNSPSTQDRQYSLETGPKKEKSVGLSCRGSSDLAPTSPNLSYPPSLSRSSPPTPLLSPRSPHSPPSPSNTQHLAPLARPSNIFTRMGTASVGRRAGTAAEGKRLGTATEGRRVGTALEASRGLQKQESAVEVGGSVVRSGFKIAANLRLPAI